MDWCKKQSRRLVTSFWAVMLCLLLVGCTQTAAPNTGDSGSVSGDRASSDEIPAFSGKAYVELDGNEPDFDETELTEKSFEKYEELDSLGRCGTAYANIGRDLMPKKERENISPVKPSGWHTVKYDCVEGKYLYNRCHLIGYQLTGENANKKNLITGTRFLNVEGMLPFENEVAEYVRRTGNHVLYRVTPLYEGDNLVAGGVQMEACSVEDKGKGVRFNIYAYNNQPGVAIDYATGESRLSQGDGGEAGGKKTPENSSSQAEASGEYILNTNTKKFHHPSCSGAADTKAENRQSYTGSREELLQQGYEPCGRCKP